MTHSTGPLTPMRRRAVDRLLIHYLELPESDQATWLAGNRARFPRLTSWLERLIENSHTVTLLDDSVRSLAERSVRAMEAETEELSMGARLGPWEVLEEAGQGGMGRDQSDDLSPRKALEWLFRLKKPDGTGHGDPARGTSISNRRNFHKMRY